MKILLFAGSLRKDSLNKKLLRVTNTLVKSHKEIETTIVDLQELQFPVYDGDIESQGIPENVFKMAKVVEEADAIIISSPEYNASISSPLKNAIDWLSRVKPLPLTKKQVLLMGASPGEFGSVRALIHTRPSFETLGNFVYPSVFALPKADKAFDEEGSLVEPARVEKLQKLVNEFITYAQKK
jgi:chromate reductase